MAESNVRDLLASRVSNIIFDTLRGVKPDVVNEEELRLAEAERVKQLMLDSIVDGRIHVYYHYGYEPYFSTDNGVVLTVPDRFVAEDNDGKKIIITTFEAEGGVMGHGEGREHIYVFKAISICTETGALIDEDARMRREGFWIKSNLVE